MAALSMSTSPVANVKYAGVHACVCDGVYAVVNTADNKRRKNPHTGNVSKANIGMEILQ